MLLFNLHFISSAIQLTEISKPAAVFFVLQLYGNFHKPSESSSHESTVKVFSFEYKAA